MTRVSQPSVSLGVKLQPTGSTMSSAIALGDLAVVQREECLPREMAVFGSAREPPGDVLSGSTLFSLWVLRSLHQQP